MKKVSENLKSTVGGLIAGFANGMLGAGGGMLAVPALQKSGLDRKEAHSSSVAVILPLSLFSAVLYLLNGNVKLSDALPFIPWGLIGAVAGTFLLRRLPDKWIRRIFAAFMIWAGIRLLLR